MPAVEDNIDHFLAHPTYALAALMPDREHVDRLLGSLPTPPGATPPVQVLHGEEGLRILDQRGNAHGRLAWFHRLLQNWTYYEQILGLYSEGLGRGEYLVVIPCAPEERHTTAQAVTAGGGHSLYYFGFETVESGG
jgi:hypothetical protein